MAVNHFKLEEPFIASISGGRTSGYMAWRILQAFGGKLPPGGQFIFTNTGKERPETLDFIERLSLEWNVEITWLEYRRWLCDPGEAPGRWVSRAKKARADRTGLEVVNYATASRNGEPFDQIVAGKQLLPNVVMRYCTEWLKVKTSNRYVRHVLGWSDGYTNAIGLRADEPDRVARLRASSLPTPGEEPIAPLAKAGVTLAEVLAFWSGQPFDLQLAPHEGNCDLCFLKGKGKLLAILRERPDLAEWWVEKEKRFVGKTPLFEAGRFSKSKPSYASLLELSQQPQLFDTCDIDAPDCRCTD